jgi:OPT oligopeptide transporter protein
MEAALIVNDSPYVEVRAVVSPTDDPTEPVNTIRAWTIGILLACFGALVNQLFSLRQPSIAIDQIVAQLIAYPLGKFWADYFPSVINPGKFTRKEHMLITVMANVAFDVGYSGFIIVVQLVPTFFNQQWASNFGYQSGFHSHFFVHFSLLTPPPSHTLSFSPAHRIWSCRSFQTFPCLPFSCHLATQSCHHCIEQLVSRRD